MLLTAADVAAAAEELAAADVLAWDGGRARYPFLDEPVADTTGAGDAVVAALAVALTAAQREPERRPPRRVCRAHPR